MGFWHLTREERAAILAAYHEQVRAMAAMLQNRWHAAGKPAPHKRPYNADQRDTDEWRQEMGYTETGQEP